MKIPESIINPKAGLCIIKEFSSLVNVVVVCLKCVYFVKGILPGPFEPSEFLTNKSVH